MALNRIHTHLGRLLVAWVAVTGLIAAEHHGVIKSGGLPVPGASVTATKGDKKLYTTSDENGRYSFADLADGSWTIEVEMLGFAKLSNEVGIAFDAPSPEWNLKFLSMSAITAAAATPAPAPPKPETPAATPAPAAAKPSETVEAAKSTPPAAAPKPAANGAAPRGQQANGARGTQGARGQNGANGRPSLVQANGFQRVDMNSSSDGAAASQDSGLAASEMADLSNSADPSLLVSGSVSRGLDMPQQNDWFGGPGGRMDGMGGPDGMNGMNAGLMGMNGAGGDGAGGTQMGGRGGARRWTGRPRWSRRTRWPRRRHAGAADSPVDLAAAAAVAPVVAVVEEKASAAAADPWDAPAWRLSATRVETAACSTTATVVRAG